MYIAYFELLKMDVEDIIFFVDDVFIFCLNLSYDFLH